MGSDCFLQNRAKSHAADKHSTLKHALGPGVEGKSAKLVESFPPTNCNHSRTAATEDRTVHAAPTWIYSMLPLNTSDGSRDLLEQDDRRTSCCIAFEGSSLPLVEVVFFGAPAGASLEAAELFP